MSSHHAAAAQPPDPLDDINRLLDLPIEDLMNIRITSVLGVSHDWLDSPAAIYVIRPEEIRRAGHRHLPESLRLVPGMFVGRSGPSTWRIGARGFAGGLANKNLVLIDGRTVYDPFHGGTFWDVQDVIFDDLDRIEVIRGPGATLWGANAMNGVINVVHKSARDTQGLYLTGGGGTYERGFGTVRYGGQLAENTWFRIYTKYFNRDAFRFPGGGRAHGDWSLFRSGFRVDHYGDEHFQLTVQAEGHTTPTRGEFVNFAQPGAHLQTSRFIGDSRASGGHVLVRLQQTLPEGNGWSLQTYYERVDRRQSANFAWRRDTFDIDYRNFFRWGSSIDPNGSHEFIWGLGYRFHTDRTDNAPHVLVDPQSEDFQTFSGFVQNTFTLVPREWFFMAGSKFEYNSFTGFEVQPSARLWWTPTENQTIWAAVSRPVRIPTRLELHTLVVLAYADTGLLAGGPPTGVIVPLGAQGNPNLSAEHMLAYEVGYRIRPYRDLTLSASAYFNDYSRLISVPPGLIGMWNNDGQGESYGVEVWADWRVAPNWRLIGSYAFVDVRVRGPINRFEEDAVPHHLAQLRSQLDITRDLEFNSALYFVDKVRQGNVPSYFRLDLGMTWRPTHNFEIAVWGQNLLHPGHREAGRNEFPRGAYLQGTLRY